MSQAAPFPATVLCALVVILRVIGRDRVATALLVSFTGLLRISEALNLMWEDVVFPDQHRSGRRVILMLPHSKRGLADVERVILDHPRVVSFLEECRRRDHEPQTHFCRITYTALPRWMQIGVEALGFEPGTFRTHSCRRGGATPLALARLSLAGIQVRGRWASERTCKDYVKQGDVLLLRRQSGVSDNQWRPTERVGSLGEMAFLAGDDL